MTTPRKNSATPKTKQRWSGTRKAAARKGPQDPRGGEDTRRGGAPSRGGFQGRSNSDSRPGRDSRPRQDSSRPWQDRPSREDRSSRDERPARDDRYSRDDRPSRPYRYDRPQRDDRRGSGSWQPREDRTPSWKQRDDRPRREGADFRGDRPRRDERPAWNRDARSQDRPYRERDERGSRDGWKPREDRPWRGDRSQRDDRPARDDRYSRNERPQREDRPAREDRPSRDGWQRPARPARQAPERPFRSERPGHKGRSFSDGSGGRNPRFNNREVEDRDDTPRHEPAPVEVSEDNGFAALGLPEVLVERMARDGITAPFPIQQATIPDAMSGRDVLGRGQTGSGKTLAFALPTLARLAGKRSQPNRPRALILVPTRELAMQVSDAIQPLAHVSGLKHKLIAGGMPYPQQIDALDRGVDILVATPGRMIDLVERGAALLDAVEVAILDEADHMAEMGFLPEVTTLLDLVPQGGQRLLFSATLDRGIDTVVERYLIDPVTHEADPGTASVSTMEHHVLLVEPQHKQPLTAELASRPGRTVVFVRTKLGADRVAMQLRHQGVMAAALHGGLNQGQRNRVLTAFKTGRIPVLVATDVAARGIHVDDVSAVIQVDPPADHKDYLHRSGRTARAGERGTVVTLALPHQRNTMKRLAKDAGLDITIRRTAPGDAELHEATGSTAPVGQPISEQDFQKLIEPEQKRRRFSGGPRREGGRPRFSKPRRRD